MRKLDLTAMVRILRPVRKVGRGDVRLVAASAIAVLVVSGIVGTLASLSAASPPTTASRLAKSASIPEVAHESELSRDGSGGGGLPDADLVSVLSQLPRNPARIRNEPQIFGRGGRVGFAVVETRDSPQAVIAFYSRELTADGWQMARTDLRVVESDPKADGTSLTALIVDFERDGMKLTLAAAENPAKNPEAFRTQIAFTVDAR